jgi:hypothetical protein
VPNAYRVALEELAAACGEARDLAEELECAARLLRGHPPDPEVTPPDLFGAAGRLRQALVRLERASETASAVWEWLSPEDREGLPSPDELLDVS